MGVPDGEVVSKHLTKHLTSDPTLWAPDNEAGVTLESVTSYIGA